MTIKIDRIDTLILALTPEHLTYEEMAEALSYRAKSGIYKRVKRLEDLGLIKSKPLKSRSRRLTNAGRQVINPVSIDAGSATPE